jgi:hypothetical protein
VNYKIVISFLHHLGHMVAQLCLIFHLVPLQGTLSVPRTESFLSYVQQFDVVPQINPKLSGSFTWKGHYPDLASSMFMLKCAQRHDQSLIGDATLLIQLCSLVKLTPVFGEKADNRLTKESSLEYSTHFWLGKYFNKEFFYAVTFQ